MRLQAAKAREPGDKYLKSLAAAAEAAAEAKDR